MSDKVVIEDHLNSDHRAILRSFLPDSFYWTVAVNGDYTLQFTAYDDGSEAYAMLTAQNFIVDHGEFFVIKQVTDTKEAGTSALEISASQYSTELSRYRIFDPNTDWSGTSIKPVSAIKDNNTGGSNDSDDATNSTGTPEDILKYYIGVADGKNGCGTKWEVHGKFDSKPIEFSPQDVKSGISQITTLWPDSVIWPEKTTIKVYSKDEFYKSHGHRIDYLHDTSQVELDIDSSTIVNFARAVGASQSKSDTGTADTGLPNGALGKGAQAVINDAKKYLGVPYVWGGAGGSRGGNPWSGMDCSSYVSQVYKDFGIYVPAQTQTMEPYFHEIPRSQIQTGDVGFYGPHGGTHHICLILDKNTDIYEPAPGQSCMMQNIDAYAPDWYARNDKMAAVVAASDDEPDAKTETYGDSEDYYFKPFMVEDKDSVDRWGYFYGDDITSDTIQDADTMKKYAMSQLHPNPDLSITVTKMDNKQPLIGDVVRLEIKPNNYVTNVSVTGYTWYPYSKVNPTTITLNSNPKSILDYDASFSKGMSKATTVINGWGQQTWSKSEVKTFGENISNFDTDKSA